MHPASLVGAPRHVLCGDVNGNNWQSEGLGYDDGVSAVSVNESLSPTPVTPDLLQCATLCNPPILAAPIKLDQVCVPLSPTLGPHGKLESCSLGIPGDWLQLQHRLRDVDRNASAIGMKLNAKKTNLMVVNSSHNRQAVPYCSLNDGDPLPVVT